MTLLIITIFIDGKIEGESLILDKTLLYEKYLSLNPEMKGKITSITFKKWIDKYCDYHNISAHNYKSNGKVLVKLTHKNK